MFHSLISGENLPKAVIMVTTRSSVAVNLPVNIICRRVEIIGFSKEKIEEYVKCFLSYDNSLITQFWNQLNDLPHVKKILFVPVILCIVLYIFQNNNQKIPETYTELYSNFLLFQLSIFYSKSRSCYSQVKFESLDNLPPVVSDLVLKFGKMGYHCLLKSKLSFSEEEINEECFDSKGIPPELDEVAIFEPHTMVNGVYSSKTYQFVHRTFQEILAAWYESKQTVLFQIKEIKRHSREKNLEAFWMFYAGLTQFKSISFDTVFQKNYVHGFKSFFSAFLAKYAGTVLRSDIPVKNVITTFFTAKLYAFSMFNSVPNSFQITLMAVAMESQSPQICKALCNSYIFYGDTSWFTVPENASTPQILMSLSYCMAHSGKKWIIQCKKLDNDAADDLLKYLRCTKSVDCSCNNCDSFTDRTDNAMFALDISSSQHSVNGLVKLVEVQKYIQWIIMSRCECVDDNLIVALAEALKENTCLKMLHLLTCNITSRGAEAIANMLKENSTLEWIGLRDNENTLKEEDVLLLLETIHSHNDTVYMLMLDSVFHTSPNVQEQLSIINAKRNNVIETLSLSLVGCIKFRDQIDYLSTLLPRIRTT